MLCLGLASISASNRSLSYFETQMDAPDGWIREARRKQNNFARMLDNRLYDEYPLDKPHMLQLKVGFAIFGSPEDAPEGMGFSDCFMHGAELWPNYSPYIISLVEFVTECAIISNPKSSSSKLAFIFVIGGNEKLECCEPVIRIHTAEDAVAGFVDCSMRYYKNWNDYLEHNVLPPLDYVYPKDGIYTRGSSGKLKLGVGRTPAGTKTRRVLNTVDTTAGWVGLGSSIVAVASSMLFPPVALGAAIVGATTGVWAGARSVRNLVDRGLHRQSLSVKNAAARSDWLMISGSFVGLASSAAISYMKIAASTGRSLGAVAKATTLTAQCASVTVNGLAVVDSLYRIINKRDEKIEWLQLGIAVFFFTHSVINFQTPKQMITEAQEARLQEIRSVLNPRQRKRFNLRVNKAERTVNPLLARADIIKSRSIVLGGSRGSVMNYKLKSVFLNDKEGRFSLMTRMNGLMPLIKVFEVTRLTDIEVNGKYPLRKISCRMLTFIENVFRPLLTLVRKFRMESKFMLILKQIILKYNPQTTMGFANIFEAMIIFVNYFLNASADHPVSERLRMALEQSAPEFLGLLDELKLICKSIQECVIKYIRSLKLEEVALQAAELAGQKAFEVAKCRAIGKNRVLCNVLRCKLYRRIYAHKMTK